MSNFTIYGNIGFDNFAKAAAEHAYTYEYRGKIYTDKPSELFPKVTDGIEGVDLHNRAIILSKMARAKAIDDKIQAQIAEERKAKIAMGYRTFGEHNSFAGYVEDLKDAYTELATAKSQLDNKFKASMEDMEQKTRSALNNNERAIIKGKMAELKIEYEETAKEYMNRANEISNKIIKNAGEHLKSFYTADGGSLDQVDIALLNCGIKIHPNEFDSLLEKHNNNPTMQRLIIQKAEETGAQSESISITSHLLKTNGKAAMDDLTALSKYFNDVMNYRDANKGAGWGIDKDNWMNCANTLSENTKQYAYSGAPVETDNTETSETSEE